MREKIARYALEVNVWDSLLERLDNLLKTCSTLYDDLEKGERKIIRDYKAPKPHTDAPAVGHGISSTNVSMHTGKIKFAPHGTAEKPIGFATVHHAHPSDHGKPKNKLGHEHEHSVDIHAPGVHESAHGMLRGKVREHINSTAFKRVVDKHNETNHDYVKSKARMGDGKKKKD